jgi:hypothetical protein
MQCDHKPMMRRKRLDFASNSPPWLALGISADIQRSAPLRDIPRADAHLCLECESRQSLAPHAPSPEIAATVQKLKTLLGSEHFIIG